MEIYPLAVGFFGLDNGNFVNKGMAVHEGGNVFLDAGGFHLRLYIVCRMLLFHRVKQLVIGLYCTILTYSCMSWKSDSKTIFIHSRIHFSPSMT